MCSCALCAFPNTHFITNQLYSYHTYNAIFPGPSSKTAHTTYCTYIWAPSSEFVSSSIPSWLISTAHAQPFRGARDLAFCLKVPLDSMLIWASSGGSGETARMRRLAWTFAARIGDKYHLCLSAWFAFVSHHKQHCLLKTADNVWKRRCVVSRLFT